MKGRKPKTSTEKALEGNRGKYGKARIVADPKGRGVPTVPEGTNKDAATLFQYVLRSAPVGLYSAADTGLLEIYANSWSRYRATKAIYEKTGPLVQTPAGPRRNPLLNVMAGASNEMIRIASELGLSPVSRARLAATAPPLDDTALLLLGDELDTAGWNIPQSVVSN